MLSLCYTLYTCFNVLVLSEICTRIHNYDTWCLYMVICIIYHNILINIHVLWCHIKHRHFHVLYYAITYIMCSHTYKPLIVLCLCAIYHIVEYVLLWIKKKGLGKLIVYQNYINFLTHFLLSFIKTCYLLTLKLTFLFLSIKNRYIYQG